MTWTTQPLTELTEQEKANMERNIAERATLPEDDLWKDTTVDHPPDLSAAEWQRRCRLRRHWFMRLHSWLFGYSTISWGRLLRSWVGTDDAGRCRSRAAARAVGRVVGRVEPVVLVRRVKEER